MKRARALKLVDPRRHPEPKHARMAEIIRQRVDQERSEAPRLVPPASDSSQCAKPIAVKVEAPDETPAASPSGAEASADIQDGSKDAALAASPPSDEAVAEMQEELEKIQHKKHLLVVRLKGMLKEEEAQKAAVAEAEKQDRQQQEQQQRVEEEDRRQAAQQQISAHHTGISRSNRSACGPAQTSRDHIDPSPVDPRESNTSAWHAPRMGYTPGRYERQGVHAPPPGLHHSSNGYPRCGTADVGNNLANRHGMIGGRPCCGSMNDPRNGNAPSCWGARGGGSSGSSPSCGGGAAPGMSPPALQATESHHVAFSIALSHHIAIPSHCKTMTRECTCPCPSRWCSSTWFVRVGIKRGSAAAHAISCWRNGYIQGPFVRRQYARRGTLRTTDAAALPIWPIALWNDAIPRRRPKHRKHGQHEQRTRSS